MSNSHSVLSLFFFLCSDDDEYCMVFICRVPYSYRTTISSCVAADSDTVDEVADQIAEDVDTLEDGNWIDIILDFLGLIGVVLLVIVLSVKKASTVAVPAVDSRETAGEASARDAELPSRRFNRRDTIFELPLEAVRV
ncbi:MAG: hypothetical protein VX367_10370 [SAR324 cluster bacterium]|nr:hypothetical protein [SAR324 cluster bacterium]